MSRRFRVISWIVAVSDVLIGCVFMTSHEAFVTPTWTYVFLFIPWQVWCGVFFLTGVGIAGAIGTGEARHVRKAACVSVVALLVWATEFALLVPAILNGARISWLGMVLTGTLASLELWYLGLPASSWLDRVEDDLNEYSVEH